MTYALFVVRRLLKAVPVLFGVTLVVFVLIHLVPGDPARTALGIHATPRSIERLDHDWGLDRSLPDQYRLFVERVLSGDLGTSLRYGRSAGALVIERLPISLWLIVYSTILTIMISVPLAFWAASRPGGIRDKLVRVISVAGLGVPGFWLGLILIEFLAVQNHLLPASGYGAGFTGHLESLFLPSLTIAAAVVPLIVRSLRAELLKVSRAEYVTTAQAKGLTEGRIRARHIFRNALAPSVTILAVNVSFMVGGLLVIEQIFALGGVGSLMLAAISARDFPVVQAVTLILAFLVVLVNIAGDLIQALLDPRVEVLS